MHAQSCLTLCDPWTIAHRTPLSMAFPRQEYWNGWPFPPPEDLPDPEMEPAPPMSPVLAGGAFTRVTCTSHVQIPPGILPHSHCLGTHNPRETEPQESQSPPRQHSILLPSNILSILCLSGCQDHSCCLFTDSGLGHRAGRKQ